MIGFACNFRIPLAKCLIGIPITFCNSTKSSLSPFGKFAKSAQITFGAIAKGNLLPFAMCFKKQADFL
jgi:hypothetical protein